MATASLPRSTIWFEPPTDVIELLTRVRERTLQLLEPLSDEDAMVQHDALMSPVVWDLGHIAAFEKLWLQDQLDAAVRFGDMPGTFNPFEHPRAERGRLPLPSKRVALDELARVRDATLKRYREASAAGREASVYLYHMVAQHESQHQETILQTLQLKQGAPYTPLVRMPPPRARAPEEFVGRMVRFDGGTVTIGTDDTLTAYDNERPAHTVEVAPFEIDAAPVTNGEYAQFVGAGGYRTASFWSAAGARWLSDSSARAPRYWRQSDGEWLERAMDRESPIDPDAAVCHVCFYEAEAFAEWAGKRLPTEYEWEAAATWDTSKTERRRNPWGDAPSDASRANVDQVTFTTAPVGAYDANVSPCGCYGMIGDVWEWTSTDFRGYAGFRAFPYAEYSEVFFGDEYKVLRGGSWATAAHVARATFRNWDFPIRRQIFSGFRCARDA